MAAILTHRAEARRAVRRFRGGLAVVMAGFLVFMLGTTAAAITEIAHPVLVALLGFGMMAAGGFLLSFSEARPPSVGAPPPPGVPHGVVKLTCPTCGATPRSVDTSTGVVVCDYCETKYLV